MKILLTDRFCQHAKSKVPQIDYFDETVKGLALRGTSHGTKAGPSSTLRPSDG